MSKKQNILDNVKKIISSYTQKLTLRQIYYRLVAKLIIPNTKSQYKYLSAILVEARKSKAIRYDSMEDRTREVINESKCNYFNFKYDVQYELDDLKKKRYILASNLYQHKITLIVLEKQALEGIFRSALNKNAILIVCKGYNSLTQIWDLSKILENDNRQVHCRFFSDFDPSGLDIQRNFIEQCKDLGIKFSSFRRIGLNMRQIKKYNLPFAPTKLSDSRAKNWRLPGVVELDALDPNLLESLIKKTCDENWNREIELRKDRLERVINRRFRKHFAKGLIELAEELKKEV
ncbi:MAG: hypothetical protein ACTSRI_02780 [Promethearchaeota archaeon]